MTIHKRLCEGRRRQGMTMKYVAQRLKLHPSTISKIEHGQQDITIGRLVILCRLYGISAPTLIAEQLGREEQILGIKQIAGLL